MDHTVNDERLDCTAIFTLALVHNWLVLRGRCEFSSTKAKKAEMRKVGRTRTRVRKAWMRKYVSKMVSC